MRITHNLWTLMALMVAARLVAGAEDAASKDELAVPSEKVIKSFVTTAKEKPDSKDSVDLQVNFKPAVLPARSMEAYRSKGKIPFTVSVELFKTIAGEDGAEKQSIFEGSANIVVVDKAGLIVSKKTEDLSALCPSWTGVGGYLGEVTKTGTYKAYVWLVHGKKTFGKVLELELK